MPPWFRSFSKAAVALEKSAWTRRLTPAITLLSGQGAREGYLAAIDQGVISLSNFLATIILARNVSPTDLGVYGVGFIALRLVRSFQEGLLVQPLNVFGAGMDPLEFKRYLTSTTLFQVALAGASALIVAVGGWVLTALGNDVAGPALFSLWFAFLWWQLQEHIRRALYTRGLVFNAVLNTILANILRLGIMLWWASQGRLNGIGGLDAIAWGSLGALIPGLWSTRSYWTRDWADLKETWRRNWGFGRWMLGGALANWVAVEFYPVLTAGMISFAAAGAYRALQNLVAPVHLLLRATDTFLTPRAAKLFDQDGAHALGRTLRLIYWIAGLPILGVLGIALLFPRPLLHFFYGETYLAYSSSMALMALFYALWFIYWPLQTAFKAARLSQPIFVANLLAILAMFTVGVWAIQRWGVAGTIGGQALNALIVGATLWATWFKIRKRP
jgi:O-antigen/teichoic acid export membrane protein